MLNSLAVMCSIRGCVNNGLAAVVFDSLTKPMDCPLAPVLMNPLSLAVYEAISRDYTG